MLTTSKLVRVGRTAAPVSIGRQLLLHAAAGMVLGWALLAGLVATDVANLGTLIWHDEAAPVVLALLGLQFGGGFAALTTATAVFMLPRKPEQP